MATAIDDTRWRKIYSKMTPENRVKAMTHLDECIAQVEKDIKLGHAGFELSDLTREREIAQRVHSLEQTREAQGRDR